MLWLFCPEDNLGWAGYEEGGKATVKGAAAVEFERWYSYLRFTLTVSHALQTRAIRGQRLTKYVEYQLSISNTFMRIAILLFVLVESFGQQIVTKVQNPLVRRGDQAEISINLPESKGDAANKRKTLSGSIFVSTEEMSVGRHTVGPLTLMIDGTRYSASAVTLKVHQELPKDARQGLWVSVLEDDHSIVLEQRIAVEQTVDRSSSSAVAVGTNQKGLTFAELNEEVFEASGIVVFMRSSTSSVGFATRGDMSTGYTQMTTLYTYERFEKAKGSILITAPFYRGLPNGVALPVVELK